VKIQDVLEKRGVLTDLKAKDKADLLAKMARYLASLYDLKNVDTIVQKIFERETQMSTGIGYGIAIPHARLDNIDGVFMVAARCVKGVDFGAIDDQTVHIIFMMISPTNTSAELTGLLSSLSKIMSYQEMRERMLGADGPEAFLSALVDGENRYAA
jgi:mannitol/fructose-specific phosphotransferase system IIA component (Ntr-type)